jgi:hypothetical protein
VAIALAAVLTAAFVLHKKRKLYMRKQKMVELQTQQSKTMELLNEDEVGTGKCPGGTAIPSVLLRALLTVATVCDRRPCDETILSAAIGLLLIAAAYAAACLSALFRHHHDRPLRRRKANEGAIGRMLSTGSSAAEHRALVPEAAKGYFRDEARCA